MNIPDYVSLQEVKRVCGELKIRDWTLLKKAEVLPEEAKAILAELDTGEMKIAIEDFQLGPISNLEFFTYSFYLLQGDIVR